MRNRTSKLALTILAIIIVVVGCGSTQKNGGNLFPGHMLAPAELAKMIKDGSSSKLVILNIGPRKNIPGAVKLGLASEEDGMKAYRAELAKLPRDTEVVIYCGCCPYEHCPNVRPAVELLSDMKFTNYRVVDMPNNINVDWINKGYPMAQQ